jgi:hemolysin III
MTLAAADFKPMLRGYIHLAAAIASPFALLYLLYAANSPAAHVGAAIFGASLMILFTTSASYHILPWPPGLRGVMKRLDHSAIFVLIGGSYTPFCLQSMGWRWGIPVLATVWGLSLLGIVLKTGWPGLPRWMSAGAYLAVGWVAIVAVPPLVTNLPPGALAVLLVSGLLYSAGAAMYALRWPNPLPRVFGHHEIFHAFVTAGCVGVYAVVAVSVLPS